MAEISSAGLSNNTSAAATSAVITTSLPLASCLTSTGVSGGRSAYVMPASANASAVTFSPEATASAIIFSAIACRSSGVDSSVATIGGSGSITGGSG